MTRTRHTGLVTLVGVLCALLLLPAAQAQQQQKKEYVFRGKVEKVDPKAKMLTVNNENIQGWMGPMTMTYGVDKEDVVQHVKAGDQITAKVYDGDFKTLYNVQVVPPAKK